jgi:transcriptional regulator with XRE-family HTH domain
MVIDVQVFQGSTAMKAKAQKNRIKDLREERGISSRKLAQQIGTSAPHMSRLEAGQSPLSIEWILKLSKVLGVNTHEIVDLPLDKKLSNSCDDALLGSVLGWLLEASEKYKIKLSRQDLSKWASYVYKEAVEQPLNFKQTKYLAVTIIKVIRQVKA